MKLDINLKLTKNMQRVLIGLFSVFFIICIMGYIKGKTREGLSNPSHTEFVSKGIKNDVESAKDSLHLVKYQDNYKEILADMASWCDLEILKTIVQNKINIDDGVTTQNTEIITSLNQWAEFRNNLQNVSDNVLSNLPTTNSSSQ
jgi:hypothetical protein